MKAIILCAVNCAVNGRTYNVEKGRDFYMAKRGENIYRREDGRWEGRYIKGRRSDRRLIYGYVYARKYSDCKEKLDQAKAKHRYVRDAVKKCGTGTVGDFLRYWLYNIAKPQVKVSTLSNYAAIMEKWLLPFCGNKKLREIGKEDVQRFIGSLPGQGLSPGTVRNIYSVLHTAMKKAKEYDYVSVNPCEGICLPKMEKKEARLFTLQEQKALEQVAKENKNGFAILLASYTGLRVGEICGLTWEDVDLKNGVLHVSRTIRRVQCHDPAAETKTVLITGSTKSDRSRRTIPLPSCILKLFGEHQKTSAGEYVFSCQGHPLEPRILQYRFKVLLKKAGLADINFHALRHTFATRCMELCFDIKTLSEILGHASAKMTLDRYGHSQMEHKRSVMNTLNELFARSA